MTQEKIGAAYSRSSHEYTALPQQIVLCQRCEQVYRGNYPLYTLNQEFFLERDEWAFPQLCMQCGLRLREAWAFERAMETAQEVIDQF